MRSHKNLKIRVLSCLLCFLAFFALKTPLSAAEEEDFNLFTREFGWVEWSDGKHMLRHHLNEQAFAFLDTREREISALKTREDWIKRQKKVKEILQDMVGPFPEKTPLKAKVTGKIQREGLFIEKIVYESMPRFYVTGCLFIPQGVSGKRPAILLLSGHYGEAFRAQHYQQLIYNLVKKGFIVFAIDPLGQGERFQYYDPEKQASLVGECWDEHDQAGRQCFLCGINIARYFIWDAVRGIDYLLTRSEVDPERIGVTGNSGGGTQTAYVAAFDDRIAAAAPSCYLTGFRRLLESLGADDAEQNIFPQLARGISHEDYIEAIAPKPYLIVSQTRDWFSIQGAREVFKEAGLAYRAFGKENNLQMTEDDNRHGYSRKNREAIYAFFQKVLEFPGSPVEEDTELLKPDQLQVTPTGQLSTSLGGETVFSLNQKDALELIEKIESSRKDVAGHLNQVKLKARELSGYLEPVERVDPVFRGRYHRTGYSIEMYVLQGENEDYVVPLLLFVPEGGGKYPALVYCHPEGKTAAVSPGGDLEKLVSCGYIVAAPDLIGTGETGDKSLGTDYGAMLIGKSRVGLQAGDIVRVVDMLKERSDVESGEIAAVAFGELAPALLHAAVFEPSIKGVALLEAPVSYRSIVMSRLYDFRFSCAVTGALTAYDLPDLEGCLSPRKIMLIELKDARKQPATSELVNRELGFPRRVYSLDNAPEKIKVVYHKPTDYIYSIVDWLSE
ncbi:MAG TPA: acetylxylan esterase [archaeon]|nr:acetylxylan esterase [archaeon]